MDTLPVMPLKCIAPVAEILAGRRIRAPVMPLKCIAGKAEIRTG